ncbi:hypothetical protein [Pseudaestuariivita sp.]|uniref:hypothetical protein n=1 Tax=Pseudaestuariivita sp. TaxID=2211669 RepID=UPI00405933C3
MSPPLLKIDFALSLSFEGIRLLERAADGWHLLGDVPLDSPDLRAALAEVRFRAEARGTAPVTVKLIIPNEQIRYLDTDMPAGDEAIDEAVRTALDGATPYPVAELAYDYVAADGRLHIAAVARETLQEAVGFARDHAFDPAAHVAIAPDGTFDREVLFGAVDSSRKVVPDPKPIAVTGTVGVTPSEHDTGFTASASASIGHAPAETDPELVDALAPAGERDGQDHAAAAGDAKNAAPEPAPLAAAPTITIDEAQREPLASTESASDAPASVAFTSARAAEPSELPEPTAPEAAAPEAALEADTEEPAVTAPVAPPPPLPDGAARPDVPVPTKAPTGLGPAPKAPINSKLTTPGGFTSIRGAQAKARAAAPAVKAPAPAKTPEPPATTASVSAPVIPIDGPSAPTTAWPDQGKPPPIAATDGAKSGGFFSRSLRASKTEPEAKPAPTPPLPAPSQSVPSAATVDESERMTVFGARNDTGRGKSRYLGLLLTVLLLVVLVGVAAMAAVFVDERIARFFAPKPDVPTAAELAEDDIPLIPAPTAPAGEAPVELAALSSVTSDSGPDTPGLRETLSTPAPAAPPLSEDEAREQYAVTGIWQIAPEAPGEPQRVPLGDVYEPSLDPTVPAQDAVALPDAKTLDHDTALGPVSAPAPAGTLFDLDARGLVRATPEGALSPDGVPVYAGRPPLVPPIITRDGAAVEADTDANAAAAAAEEQRRLAAVRPSTRPEGLIDAFDRAQLGGRTRAELAALRPKLRPASAQQAALARIEAERAAAEVAEELAQTEEERAARELASASAFAVAASREPQTRPRNFSRIVARAVRQAPQAEPEETTRVVAQVKPKTVKPPAPSRNSVTRNATVKNAIRLNRINLIGVYGKPSSRRALVRMANGRYKKVKVGDRLDGGRISAIGEDQLRYTKSGRAVTLKLPKT